MDIIHPKLITMASVAYFPVNFELNSLTSRLKMTAYITSNLARTIYEVGKVAFKTMPDITLMDAFEISNNLINGLKNWYNRQTGKNSEMVSQVGLAIENWELQHCK